MNVIHTHEDWGWCGPQGLRRPHRPGEGEPMLGDVEGLEVVTCERCGQYLWTVSTTTRGV